MGKIEGKLQKKSLDRAKQEKIFAHKVISETSNGLPDTLFLRKLLVPKLVYYDLVMLELKAGPKSKRSEEQIKIGNHLLDLGVTFEFVHEYERVCEILDISPKKK